MGSGGVFSAGVRNNRPSSARPVATALWGLQMVLFGEDIPNIGDEVPLREGKGLPEIVQHSFLGTAPIADVDIGVTAQCVGGDALLHCSLSAPWAGKPMVTLYPGKPFQGGFCHLLIEIFAELLVPHVPGGFHGFAGFLQLLGRPISAHALTSGFNCIGHFRSHSFSNSSRALALSSRYFSYAKYSENFNILYSLQGQPIEL